MELEVGLRGHEELVVSERDLASFAGNAGVDVLSTHRIVLLMEMAARNAVLGRIPEGKIALGTRIEIRHIAASPLGAHVRAEAQLRSIGGNKLLFDVAAFDQSDKLAEGENEHILVSIVKFKNRVQKKSFAQGE